MNICKLFSKKRERRTEEIFNDIIGYNNIKRLFRLALDSDEETHILLSGPPASAKTMFLESLRKLKFLIPVFVVFFITDKILGISMPFCKSWYVVPMRGEKMCLCFMYT
jgi:MoxR-like ATPase